MNDAAVQEHMKTLYDKMGSQVSNEKFSTFFEIDSTPFSISILLKCKTDPLNLFTLQYVLLSMSNFL